MLLSDPRFDAVYTLNNGVTCDPKGLFVGGAPLLEPPCDDSDERRLRPLDDLNRDLSEVYGLPIDVASKLSSLSSLAQALRRGETGRAQILALHLRLPDPPDLAKARGR